MDQLKANKIETGGIPGLVYDPERGNEAVVAYNEEIRTRLQKIERILQHESLVDRADEIKFWVDEIKKLL